MQHNFEPVFGRYDVCDLQIRGQWPNWAAIYWSALLERALSVGLPQLRRVLVRAGVPLNAM